ncbi:MAG: nucleotide exchange factor GrpE [Candidatus Thorarchaeota archaeon]|nr:MAG: nucleotide exchange factor GrpE [Candidatus Thorarchaeota archaeon]
MVRKKKGDQNTEQASEATATEPTGEAFEIVPEDPFETERLRNEDLVERLKRQQADFENYRKRVESRYAEYAKFASEGILLKVVDLFDDLDRALQADFAKDPEAAKKGIAGIRENLAKLLSQEGVQPIESVGEPFDSYYQHAVQRTCDLGKPDNIVVEEYKRGYMLKEKVLRPALVCVNRHEAIPETERDSADDKRCSKAGDE